MQKFLIVIWLLAVGQFILIPSFPPQPPSATGMIFFITLSAIATLICGKKLFLRLAGKADDQQNQETSGLMSACKTYFYGLLTILGGFILALIVYVSLTTGIAID